MRRQVSLLVSLAAVVAIAAVGASSASARPFNQATGGVTLSNPTQYLEFNAFDYGATGDRGTVTYSNPSGVGGAPVSYTADVYCAVVNSSSHSATFAYVIPSGTNPLIDGLRIVWTVTDGGSPGAGHDTAGFTALPPSATSQSDCNTPPVNNYAVTDGDLVVH